MRQHRMGRRHLCQEHRQRRHQYLHCLQFHHHRSQRFQRNLMGTHQKYRLRRLHHRLHLIRYMTGPHQYQLE